MVHTDEIRTGSRYLVRLQDDRERSVLFCTLRRFKKSQRQGGPGRQKGEDRGIPVGVSRGTGGEHVGPTPALTVGSPDPISSAADFGQTRAGYPVPVPVGFLDDLSRVLAILQRLQESLLDPADSSGAASLVGSSRARLLEELSASNRERPLGGPLSSLMARLAEERRVTTPPDAAMSETVAYGDVAAVLDPHGIFGSGNADATEGEGEDESPAAAVVVVESASTSSSSLVVAAEAAAGLELAWDAGTAAASAMAQAAALVPAAVAALRVAAASAMAPAAALVPAAVAALRCWGGVVAAACGASANEGEKVERETATAVKEKAMADKAAAIAAAAQAPEAEFLTYLI